MFACGAACVRENGQALKNEVFTGFMLSIPCFSVLVGKQDTMHATYESELILVVDCFLYIIVLVAFTRDLLSRFL